MDLLAFGDPSFQSGSERSPKSKSPANSGDVLRKIRSLTGFSLESLPRTRDEVQHIAGLFPAGRQRVYLGKESTEDALKREPLRRFRRLHFATHGFIDERFPSRSAVMLTLDNNSDEDGFLEVNEIAELDLDCDLVALSACETGRGRLVMGEGIVGLSRAFLYAGARSVVVTLWNVTDVSSGRLMKGFYECMTDGANNSAALRLAKLKLLRSSSVTRHPYYWAPFVLVGN
jgi:CHAT domain-containing protein